MHAAVQWQSVPPSPYSWLSGYSPPSTSLTLASTPRSQGCCSAIATRSQSTRSLPPSLPPARLNLSHLPYTIHLSNGSAFNVRFLARQGSCSPRPAFTAPEESTLSSDSIESPHYPLPYTSLRLSSGAAFNVRLVASPGTALLRPVEGMSDTAAVNRGGGRPFSFNAPARAHPALLPKPARATGSSTALRGGTGNTQEKCAGKAWQQSYVYGVQAVKPHTCIRITVCTPWLELQFGGLPPTVS
jgi:hypothetical protein